MRRTQPQVPAPLPSVLPFKRAAERSGFPYTTLRDAYFRGDLAIVRVGRSWYVEVSELARFVERHTERTRGGMSIVKG